MNKRVFVRISLLLAVLSVLSLTGCTAGENKIEKVDFALDTVIQITLYDGDRSVLDGAFTLVRDYENTFSPTLEGSELYRLNKGEITEVSDELLHVIKTGIEYGDISDGLFDITIKSVKDLWDFSGKTSKVPDDDLIKEKLKSVDYRKIEIDGNRVALNGTQIDLGAVAKGYIGDRVREYLSDKGVTKALINLGGNVVTIGGPFKIGIKKPFSDSEADRVVEVTDRSVVTSGTYERYFESYGVRYHHILDPGTGYPIDTDLMSASVICTDSETADALSTVCLLLGKEKAKELIDSYDGIEAEFIYE